MRTLLSWSLVSVCALPQSSHGLSAACPLGSINRVGQQTKPAGCMMCAAQDETGTAFPSCFLKPIYIPECVCIVVAS